MKKIIVTGATGFIGQHVLDYLDSFYSNIKIISLVLPNDNIELIKNRKCQIVYGDIRDYEFMNELIQKEDILIHLAGIVSTSNHDKDFVYQINYIATKYITDICFKKKAKLIYTSSVHVLNHHQRQKIDENSGFNINSKRGIYEKTKSLATNYIFDMIKKGLNGTIIYPSAVIGPKDYKIGDTSKGLIMIYNHKMPFYIKGGYSFVDVRDVAKSIVLCIDNPNANQKGFIISNEYISVKQLILMVYKLQNYNKKPVLCPLMFVYMSLPIIYLISKLKHKTPIFNKVMLKTILSNGYFDNSNSIKTLNYEPIDIVQSIADTINWLKWYKPNLFK